MVFITINGNILKQNDRNNIDSDEFRKFTQKGGSIAYNPEKGKFIVFVGGTNQDEIKISTNCYKELKEKGYGKTGKIIGEGKYGQVIELKNYNYIVKIQPLLTKYKDQGYKKEVEIYNYLKTKDSEYKYHPKMVDHWECEDKGYIVLERKKGSVFDLLKANNFDLRDLKKILKLIDIFHQFGIVHLDVLPGNILFENGNNFYLTDFGLSYNTKKHKMKKQDLLNHQAFDYYILMNKLERLGYMNKKFRKEFDKSFEKLRDKGWDYDKSSKSFIYKGDKYWFISKFHKRARKLSKKRKK